MADKLLKFVTPFVPKRKPLLLDGAIGTYLLNNNAAYDKDLWTSHIAVEAPHLLESVHSEYIKAGADIIISNTFRTNPQAVKNSKYSSEFLVKRNMDIIRDCSKDKDLLIAGSNAPAEDCYQLERTISRSDLEYNHHKQICLLMENGADFILNETQSHLDEIGIICSYCFRNNIPFGLSLYIKQFDKLLSGESISEAMKLINDLNPLFISFNCTNFFEFAKITDNYELNFNWGFYLNCGQSRPDSNVITGIISPEEYIEKSSPFFEKNPVLVGTCCGSNPEHTRYLREFIDEHYKN